MDELKTTLGTEIPIDTRGILYLCEFTYNPLKLTVFREILCEDSFTALNLYAEIPNPESQLITGKTFDELIQNLHQLHKNIEDVEWLDDLSSQL